MKKEIFISSKWRRADIGDMTIYRVLPNRYVQAVGPFMLLEYFSPKVSKQTMAAHGTGAHPNRGISTSNYILKGEIEHFDSAGHHAKVGSGGIQWMKAGNGILHDEMLAADHNDDSKMIQGIQFWINLPSKNKREKPEYMAIPASEVPQKLLEKEAGWIKVIIGSFEDLASSIPMYTEQFLYHVNLQTSCAFTMATNAKHEYAVFLPDCNALVNKQKFLTGDFILFSSGNGDIEISNTNNVVMNIIVFGGAPYTEPIVTEGPFVMNSYEEIAERTGIFIWENMERFSTSKTLPSINSASYNY
jgi:redox-sensitive bicupin YhaK (pirin superfamily)